MAAILKVQDGRHRLYRKKRKHSFFNSVDITASKNLEFAISPRNIYENIDIDIVNQSSLMFAGAYILPNAILDRNIVLMN